MAKTPLSQASSYLSAAEFLKRADARTVGDLVSDTGSRVEAGSLASDPNLLAALDDSSGIVEAACLAGERYKPEDLAALTGVGQKMLFRLIANITVALLVERRPDKTVPAPASWEWTMNQLDLLRNGQRIFSFAETAAAGQTDHEVDTAPIVEDRNLTTYQAERFFGRRANRRDRL